jgi:hypothetical protein
MSCQFPKLSWKQFPNTSRHETRKRKKERPTDEQQKDGQTNKRKKKERKTDKQKKEERKKDGQTKERRKKERRTNKRMKKRKKVRKKEIETERGGDRKTGRKRGLTSRFFPESKNIFLGTNFPSEKYNSRPRSRKRERENYVNKDERPLKIVYPKIIWQKTSQTLPGCAPMLF